MSFRSFEFETAPEKHYRKGVLDLGNDLVRLSNEKRLLMLSSLFQTWKMSNNKVDETHFSLFFDALSSEGLLDMDNFLTLCKGMDSIQIIPQNYSIELLAEYSEKMRQDNKVVGLKFGFYRRLTISQIYELLLVKDTCHKLLLVAENEERTRVFKTDKIEYSDSRRLELFKRSGLFDGFALTSGTNFSDDYYRQIVKTINPGVLYASADWKPKVIDEYRHRAGLVNAKLVVMPKVTNYSTTKMEKFIF